MGYAPGTVIPVIDVGPCFAGVCGARERVARQLGDALETIGFFVLINHGVPRDLIDRTFAEARRFHAQPLAAKMALRMNEHNNGYMAMGRYAVWTSDVNDNDEPDLNEAFFTKRERPSDDPLVRAGRRFAGPNRWPEDLPGFRDRCWRVHRRDGRADAPPAAGLRAGARPAARRLRRGVRRASSRSGSHTIHRSRPRPASSVSRRTPTPTS
jgi:isopenicillin N synthase-like dioxygenase